MQITLEFGVQKTHACQCRDGILLKADQVLLSDNSRDMLLMGCFTLLFASFLLVGATLFLRSHAGLSGLEALSFDQLSVPLFLVLFLLLVHNAKLSFFKNLHSRLLECFETEHVEHGFNLSIEIEKLSISIEDLSRFTVLFSWHFRLEKWLRRPIQIKLSCDAHLHCRGLICQVFDILIGLDEQVLSTMDGLWRGDVSIGVVRYDALRSLDENNRKRLGHLSLQIVDLSELLPQKMRVICPVATYLGRGFECASAQTLSLLGLSFLHHHRVVGCASRDHHSCI